MAAMAPQLASATDRLLGSTASVRAVTATWRRRRREVRSPTAHPPNPPPVPATGWGRELQQARLATGLHVYGVANRLQIASGAFGSMVDQLESLSEAPEARVQRKRAAWIVLGFGLDPTQHGIGLDELTPEEAAALPESAAPGRAG
jgi:hypothetical protein